MVKSLFLDRDGVLNRRIIGDYVRNWSQFEWLPQVLDALALLRPHFDYIFVVTNQQGVAKGFMKPEDLQQIHEQLQLETAKVGCNIDAVYSCPDLAVNNPPCRKPNIGMALQAKKDFPDIDFTAAWMLGDSLSDLQFGERAGMCPIWILGKEDINPAQAKEMQALAINQYEGLWAFAKAYVSNLI